MPGSLVGLDPALAATLCAEGPCDLRIEFSDYGSLEAPGGATLIFGEAPVLSLGLGGTIEPGGNAAAGSPQDVSDLRSGQLVLGAGGSIQFGPGGVLALGAGGNIEYPAGAGLVLDNPMVLTLSGSTSQAQIGNIHSAGSVTVGTRLGGDIALTGAIEAGGMDVVALDPGNLIVLGTGQVSIGAESALASLVPACTNDFANPHPAPVDGAATPAEPTCAPTIEVAQLAPIPPTTDLTPADPASNNGGAAGLAPGALILAMLMTQLRRRRAI